MIEDNKPSDIRFVSKKADDIRYTKKEELLASLTGPGSEGTGIYYSQFDPGTLYMYVQHSAAEDGDGTWTITGNRRG
ncbi:MAG: hypothetical protein P8Y24_08065 [Gammaproteobacteria bacterium]